MDTLNSPTTFALQPIYGLDGEIIFAELLARFGEDNTQERIVNAEKDGSILDIDLAALRYAKRSAIPVSINVSQKSIESNLVALGQQILPGFTIEITETHKTCLRKLEKFAFEVHARGGSIALDDVGTGAFQDYSVLFSIIKATRPQWIKLPLDAEPELIRMCQLTAIPLIFELIDTRSDVEKAIGFKTTGLQGWFFDTAYGMSWLHTQRLKNKRVKANELLLAVA